MLNVFLMTLLYYELASWSIIFRSTVNLWSLSRCIILFYALRHCVSFLVLNGTASIRFASQWYTIMAYWFTLQAWTGKRPVSSVYNLLMVVTWRNSSLDRTWGIGSSGELGGWVLGLVDLNHWHFGTRCLMMLALAEGQYLVTLARVSPGHDE